MAAAENVRKKSFDCGEPNTSQMDCASGILKPLTFELNDSGDGWSDGELSSNHFIDCMVCSSTFEDVKDFRQHLNLEHKIIIAETRKIAYLKGYAIYWKKIFANRPYTEICSTFCVSSTSSEKGNGLERFYLLSDAVPEDKAIREKLKRLRLESVLKQHEIERTAKDFKRICLCCTKEMRGDRESYFNHLCNDHGLYLGQVNNIVYINQFLDLLDVKLNKKFECLYCEKVFKDSSLVKEHMRKKQHRAINPNNHDFDKFYLINYLELDRKWGEIMKEDDSEIQELGDDCEESWGGGWTDNEMNTVCLFCNQMSHDAEVILLHMKEAHDFNLGKIKRTRKLNYYQQVKLINYIRRQMYEKKCFSCLRMFKNLDDLQRHLAIEKHIAFIPENKMFDQPQYYFPTYENDNLLCALFDDTPDDFEQVDDDQKSQWLSADSVLWNESIRGQLL